MAGYSATPLAKKLGLQPGQRTLLSGMPDDLPEIGGFEGFAIRHTEPEAATRYDMVLIFETERIGLEAWRPRLPELLAANGVLWIAWPKKASRRPTTLAEGVLRELLLPIGLVDVKVCAIDSVWSGLKFMVRKNIRAKWPR